MKLLLLFIFVFLSSCVTNLSSTLPQHLKVASTVSGQVAKIIENKYQAEFEGIGWSSDKTNDLLNKITITFTIYRKININQAREMILDSVNIFLSEINKNEEIKQYIVNGYFYPSNIEIVFYIYNENKGFFYDPDLCVAGFNDNMLRYKTNDLKLNAPFKTVIYENYQEALQKVQHHEIKR